MTLAERVFAKVDASGDCWEWTGALSRNGYGHAYVGGGRDLPRYAGAHRVVYELLVGPIPAGMQLDHLCRNHRCVNPDHLEPVTPWGNTHRSPVVMRLKSSHCPSGHPYDEANTYTGSDGGRFCRECGRARNRSRYHAARTSGGFPVRHRLDDMDGCDSCSADREEAIRQATEEGDDCG